MDDTLTVFSKSSTKRGNFKEISISCQIIYLNWSYYVSNSILLKTKKKKITACITPTIIISTHIHFLGIQAWTSLRQFRTVCCVQTNPPNPIVPAEITPLFYFVLYDIFWFFVSLSTLKSPLLCESEKITALFTHEQQDIYLMISYSGQRIGRHFVEMSLCNGPGDSCPLDMGI